jgi:hypothetical protein
MAGLMEKPTILRRLWGRIIAEFPGTFKKDDRISVKSKIMVAREANT